MQQDLSPQPDLQTSAAAHTNPGEPFSPVEPTNTTPARGQNFWQYIWRTRKFWFTVLVLATVAWEVFAAVLAVRDSQIAMDNNGPAARGLGLLFAAPILVWFVWIRRAHKQYTSDFLRGYAQAHGFAFDASDADDVHSCLLKNKGQQSTFGVVRGTYGGGKIRLIAYQLRRGLTRKPSTFRTTILELSVPFELPNALIINTNSLLWRFGLGWVFGNQKLTLDVPSTASDATKPASTKQFDAFGAPEAQDIVQAVFTPEILAAMEHVNSQCYSVEFTANRIYIYPNQLLLSDAKVAAALQLGQQLHEKLATLNLSRAAQSPAVQANETIQPSQTLASGAQTEQSGTPTSLGNTDSLSIGTRLAIAIPVAIWLLGATLFAHRVLTTPYQSAADLRAAQTVSDEFVAALQKSDTTTAYNLEAPSYQAVRSQQVVLQTPAKFMPPSTPISVQKVIGVPNNHGIASLVYTFNDAGKTYYVKIWLENLGDSSGGWRVNGYQSGHTALKPTTY